MKLPFATALSIALAAAATAQQPAAPAPPAATTAPPAATAAPAATTAQGSAYRKFSLRDGRAFHALVVDKTDVGVTFKLQDGRTAPMSIRDLSEPDQLFVRKWTKFKDALMKDSEFANATIKEVLELRGYQSFEFDIEGNHIFIEGEVGGKQMKLMVDTGAGTSLLNLASAQAANLDVGPMDQRIRGVGGEAPAAVTRVPSIKLGDAVIENRKVLAAELFKYWPVKGDFDAILGADFLREFDAVISYREGRMFLKPDNSKPVSTATNTGKTPGGLSGLAPRAATPAPAAEFRRWTSADGKSFFAALDSKDDKQAVFRLQNGQRAPVPLEKLSEADRDLVAKWSPLRDGLAKSPEFRSLTVKELLELRGYQSFAYRLDGNHIMVDGLVNTTKARFMIDTGAGGGVLHLGFAKHAGIEVGPLDQKIFGIGGEAPAARINVAKLTMGDAVLEKRDVMTADIFKDAPPVGGANHDGLFGADFLRELDAVINYKENRIFLKPDLSDAPLAKPADAPPAKPADAPPAKPADAPAEKPAAPAK